MAPPAPYPAGVGNSAHTGAGVIGSVPGPPEVVQLESVNEAGKIQEGMGGSEQNAVSSTLEEAEKLQVRLEREAGERTKLYGCHGNK